MDQGILSDGILPSCLVAFLYGAPRQGLDCGCGITAFSSFIFLHPSFFVRLEKPVSYAHLRAHEGLVLDRSGHGGRLGQAGAATCDGLGIGLLSGNGKKTAEPYIRSA